MPLTTILSFENEVAPFFGNPDNDDCKLLRLIQKWTENAARQHVHHCITQETISGELQRRDDFGAWPTAEQFELVGDKVYSEPCAGGDSHILQLDNGFVRSITSVYEDYAAVFGQGGTDFASGTLLTSGTDYYLELDKSGLSKSGRLIRNGRNWSSTPGTIKVTYVAGLTAAELNDEYSFVKLALLEDMQVKFNTAKSQQTSGGGPLKRVSYAGDVSYEYAVSATSQSLWSLSPGCRAKLTPIVRTAL